MYDNGDGVRTLVMMISEFWKENSTSQLVHVAILLLHTRNQLWLHFGATLSTYVIALYWTCTWRACSCLLNSLPC